MRSHICCHTYSNTHRSITEMIWKFCRKHNWFLKRSIKVISPINRILLKICKHFLSNFSQSCLGIPHRSRSITIDRTKVSLPINERISHRPRLSKSYHCLINRRISMWMVFTHYISDNSRRLFVLLVVEVIIFVHSIKDSSQYGFKSISGIWQSTSNDH